MLLRLSPAYPSNAQVLIFLYPTDLLYEKVFFTHFFLSPLSSKLSFLQIVVTYFYRLTASLLISSTLDKQFFALFSSFLRRHQKSASIFYQIAYNLVFLLVHSVYISIIIMIQAERHQKNHVKKHFADGQLTTATKSQ